MEREGTAAGTMIPAEVEEAIVAFLRGLIAADYSLRTIKASSMDLEQFALFLAERGVERPGAITRTDVSDFAVALAESGTGARSESLPVAGRSGAGSSGPQKPYARSSIARKLSVIRNFLNFCQDNGLIETSPGAGVGSPKVPRRLPQVLTQVQAAGLLDAIGVEKPLEVRDRALFELIYSSGLRCQEVLDLRLRDINLGSREVRVKGKGERSE
jgi:site-specific recombinase XerD